RFVALVWPECTRTKWFGEDWHFPETRKEDPPTRVTKPPARALVGAGTKSWPGVSRMPQAISPPASALPPGPLSPSWWQLVRFAGDPLSLLDECHRRYGDAFTLHVAGNGRFVMLSDPEAVREV